MVDKLGSHSAFNYMGFWFVEDDGSASLVTSNSPHNLDLSGKTHGLHYMNFYKNESYVHPGKTGHEPYTLTDGETETITVGADVERFTLNAFVTTPSERTLAVKFAKQHDVGDSTSIFLIHREDISANGYQIFIDNNVAEKLYVPVVILDWKESKDYKRETAKYMIQYNCVAVW